MSFPKPVTLYWNNNYLLHELYLYISTPSNVSCSPRQGHELPESMQDNIIIIIIEIYKPNQIPEMLLSALQEEY